MCSRRSTRPVEPGEAAFAASNNGLPRGADMSREQLPNDVAAKAPLARPHPTSREMLEPVHIPRAVTDCRFDFMAWNIFPPAHDRFIADVTDHAGPQRKKFADASPKRNRRRARAGSPANPPRHPVS